MTCTCTVQPIADLDAATRLWIACNLTKAASAFNRALVDGVPDGEIAIVRCQGQMVGWARTESWLFDQDGVTTEFQTLEAFVFEDCRERGVASFAAAGLRTAGYVNGVVAVFHPAMERVASRAGLVPVLFALKGTSWRPSSERPRPSGCCAATVGDPRVTEGSG